MGLNLKDYPHLIPLLAPETKRMDSHPEPKSGDTEKSQQNQFINHLLFENEKGADIPFTWHSMHKPSRATPGTPDVGFGINGQWIWLEFKKDYSAELSPHQKEFGRKCEKQRCRFEVVYSANQAVKILEEARRAGIIVEL